MGRVSMPIEAFYADPHIQFNHIDGPVMTWAGLSHWLTWRERFALCFGRTSVEILANKRFGRNAAIAKIDADLAAEKPKSN
jgi:hypothetical protein